MKAIWIIDYDYWAEDDEDGMFQRPGCPKCKEPIFLWSDGKYRCPNCGKTVKVKNKEMKKWMTEREETKTEIQECKKFPDGRGGFIGCGEMAMEVHYYRDARTMKWRIAGGHCKNCGTDFIV